jgi:hypothetical protein
MSSQAIVSDTFSLSGPPLQRLRQILELAEREARAAQNVASGRHVEDALAEVEQAIRADLARLENALDDDSSDAENAGDPGRVQRAWFPRYQAA